MNENDASYIMKNATVLSQKAGVPEELARFLLEFTGGDMEGAYHILQSIDKDILVIKGKFLSQRYIKYGLFALFFNYKTSKLEWVISVVSGNPEMGRVDINQSWKMFLVELSKMKVNPQVDEEASQRIEENLTRPEKLEEFSSYVKGRGNLDLINIKRFISSELGKVLLDSEVIIKTATEETDVFQYYKAKKELSMGVQFETDLPSFLSGGSMGDLSLLSLNIEPVLSPVEGKAVETLKPGTEILVKITDQRSISQYLANLISSDPSQLGAKTEDGKPILKTRVVTVQENPETQNCVLVTEFGPGIRGTAVVKKGVKVKLAPIFSDQKPGYKKESRQEKSKDKDEEGEKSGVLFWVINFTIVAIVILIVLYFIFK